MDAYAAHLAMAALVGASIVAISAYFMHRKTLTQVLEFARAECERERHRGGRGRRAPRGEEEDGAASDVDVDADEAPLPSHYKRRGHPNHQPHPRRKASAAAAYYQRASASPPDVSAVAAASARGEEDGREGEERRPVMNGPFSAPGGGGEAQAMEDQRSLGIPPGLPRLHTFPEGTYESEHMMSDFSPH